MATDSLPLESALVATIEKSLRSRPGSFTTKIHGGPYQRVGLPDIYHLEAGITFWLEVKRPGNSPTQIQVATMAKLTEAGAHCAVVYNVTQAVHFVERTLYELKVKGGI